METSVMAGSALGDLPRRRVRVLGFPTKWHADFFSSGIRAYAVPSRALGPNPTGDHFMSQRLLCSLGFFCLALSMATIGAQAQYGSLPLGTLAVSGSTPCPGSGWYNYQGTYVACYVAAITNCAGASPLGVTFGYLD